MNTFLRLSSYLRNLKKDEKGQGLVEYALILFLVSIATITMLQALGIRVGVVFTSITTALGG